MVEAGAPLYIEDVVTPGLAVLEARAASVPEHALALLREPPDMPNLDPSARVVVTGVGASAGPARYLAQLLAHACGLRATFVPTSAFAPGAPAPRADVLVVFSQYLSPSARLALSRARDYRRTVLFTSAHDAPPHVMVVRLPPEQESGAVVRIAGPSIAMFAGALFAKHLGAAIDLSGVPAALRAARALAADARAILDARLAVVSAGELADAYRALSWKLLEGWAVPEPAAWDVLELAHGPLQQHGGERLAVVSCESAHPGERDLFDRLDTRLVPGRHVHVRLRSSLPRPTAILEHDAMTTALLLSGLRARPREPLSWIGQGPDGSLLGPGGLTGPG